MGQAAANTDTGADAAAAAAAVYRRQVAQDDKADSVSTKGAASSRGIIPPAKWTFNNKGLPQAVAHRGFKASFPENTMGAFRGAVDVGAHGIETDVHLTKDDVVVIAHDKDLKRCYGVNGLVRDHDWAYLQTLRTLREPRQPMPSLTELLSYLAEPGNEAVWLLLDIKVDDAVEAMIPRLAATIAAASPNRHHWSSRIVLGCWTAKHLRACHEQLPEFAVAWIGSRLELAREYCRVPNVAMNVRQETLYYAGGPRFLRQCQEERRPVYAWTVNEVAWMQWAIKAKLDCVITDDPKLFLEVCEEHRSGGAGTSMGTGGSKRIVHAQNDLRTTALYVLLAVAFPVLLRLYTWRSGYYKRVGNPRETRKVLQPLAEQ